MPEHRAFSEWPDQLPLPEFWRKRPEPAANFPGKATETFTAPFPVTRPLRRVMLAC